MKKKQTIKIVKTKPTLAEFLDKYYTGWRGGEDAQSHTIYVRVLVGLKYKTCFWCKHSEETPIYEYQKILYMGKDVLYSENKIRHLYIDNWTVFNRDIKPLLIKFTKLTGEKFVIHEPLEF